MDYERRRTARRRRRIMGFIFIILSCGIFFRLLLFKPTPVIISPLADSDDAASPSNTIRTIFQTKPKAETQLLIQIKEFIEDQTGNYSVYIYDISRGKGYGINETTIFTAASVNKVQILAAMYYEAQREKIDLDRRITLQAKDIQDYGTGSLRYEGPGGLYSLKSLAQIMIEKCDNTAAYILTGIIGESRIQELVTSWGLTQTDIKNNKTSNSDMSKIFLKMYKGQITNHALTIEMLGFLDDSDFENRLPALLPKDITVYHKIGNEVGNIHDVGIILHEKYPYYLGVMTNDIISDEQAEDAIAQISKLVFDFVTTN